MNTNAHVNGNYTDYIIHLDSFSFLLCLPVPAEFCVDDTFL